MHAAACAAVLNSRAYAYKYKPQQGTRDPSSSSSSSCSPSPSYSSPYKVSFYSSWVHPFYFLFCWSLFLSLLLIQFWNIIFLQASSFVGGGAFLLGRQKNLLGRILDRSAPINLAKDSRKPGDLHFVLFFFFLCLSIYIVVLVLAKSCCVFLGKFFLWIRSELTSWIGVK